MNLKIPLSVILILTITLLIVYLINDWYLQNNDKERINNPIFSDFVLEDENKIYLIGNSRIGMVNHNFITNYLHDGGYYYSVYQLAIPATGLNQRIPMIEQMILTQPKLVVVSTDPQEFVPSHTKLEINNQLMKKSENIFFDLQLYFHTVLIDSNIFKLDLNNFENPKLTSLQLIQKIINNEKLISKNTHIYKTPFALEKEGNRLSDLKIPELLSSSLKTNNDKIDDIKNTNQTDKRKPDYIVNYEELKQYVKKTPWHGDISLDSNANYDALKTIVTTLQENDIPVLVLITPRPQLYLDTIPDDEIDKYHFLLDKLHNETGVSVFSLLDDYSNLSLWWDHSHVTADSKGLIFSEDIAKIIISEINKNAI